MSFAFRSSLYSGSRLCQNTLYVAYGMGVNVNEIVNCGNGVVWKNRVIEKWKRSIDENDVRVSMQVRELVDMRDGFEPWLLEPMEIEDHLISIFNLID